MENNIRPKTPKNLNSKQKLLCEMLSDPEYKMMTKTDMAKRLGISRPTMYNWLARADMNKYTNELIEYFSDAELGNVWKALTNTCKKGNVKAIQLYFEMKKMYIPPNQVVDLQMKDATANINIISNIPRPSVAGGDEDDKD